MQASGHTQQTDPNDRCVGLARATTLLQMDAETRRTKFIFVECLLKTQRARARLDAHRMDVVKKNARRGGRPDTLLIDALWEGFCALSDQACAEAKAVLTRGQLLFAFEGATVLEGGAA